MKNIQETPESKNINTKIEEFLEDVESDDENLTDWKIMKVNKQQQTATHESLWTRIKNSGQRKYLRLRNYYYRERNYQSDTKDPDYIAVQSKLDLKPFRYTDIEISLIMLYTHSVRLNLKTAIVFFIYHLLT